MGNSKVCRLLRAALVAKKLTDRQLAEATTIDIGLIRRYLTGQVKVGTKNAGKVASALGLTLEAVLYGTKHVASEAGER